MARLGDRAIVWPADLAEGRIGCNWPTPPRSPRRLPLIVAPPAAYARRFRAGWLLAVQLYGVRSARNWGIGEFTDLEALIDWPAELGTDGVGSIPCTRCSPIDPAIAVPIRRTAGCSSMRSISMSKKFPDFSPARRAASAARPPEDRRYGRLQGRRRSEMACSARRPLRHSGRILRPAEAGISTRFAPNARRCCRVSPALRCCGTNSTSPGGNGRNNGGSPMKPNVPELRGDRTPPRLNSSSSCNGPRTGNWVLAGILPANSA